MVLARRGDYVFSGLRISGFIKWLLFSLGLSLSHIFDKLLLVECSFCYVLGIARDLKFAFHNMLSKFISKGPQKSFPWAYTSNDTRGNQACTVMCLN